MVGFECLAKVTFKRGKVMFSFVCVWERGGGEIKIKNSSISFKR